MKTCPEAQGLKQLRFDLLLGGGYKNGTSHSLQGEGNYGSLDLLTPSRRGGLGKSQTLVSSCPDGMASVQGHWKEERRQILIPHESLKGTRRNFS